MARQSAYNPYIRYSHILSYKPVSEIISNQSIPTASANLTDNLRTTCSAEHSNAVDGGKLAPLRGASGLGFRV